MLPATAFSVACGTIQEKSSNMKFVEKWLGCICLMELLMLDKVYRHMSNYNKTFSVYHYYLNVLFIYLTVNL